MSLRPAVVVLTSVLLWPAPARAELVPVRHPEGLVHGFLVLRTLEGQTIADGELIQSARGNLVTSRLVFRFKDGSLHDETAVFSQRRTFRLVSDHLIQKGPAFAHAVDVTLDGRTGQVTVRYPDAKGVEKVLSEHLALPADVSNGVVLTLLKNIRPDVARTTVSMVAAAPKPRLVKLLITPLGEEPFTTGGTRRKAMHYVVKVDIGGVAGVVAPLIGKQPADTHVWILQGDAPAFVKSEGPMSADGPSLRTELVSPVWPEPAPTPAP